MAGAFGALELESLLPKHEDGRVFIWDYSDLSSLLSPMRSF